MARVSKSAMSASRSFKPKFAGRALRQRRWAPSARSTGRTAIKTGLHFNKEKDTLIPNIIRWYGPRDG